MADWKEEREGLRRRESGSVFHKSLCIDRCIFYGDLSTLFYFTTAVILLNSQLFFVVLFYSFLGKMVAMIRGKNHYEKSRSNSPKRNRESGIGTLDRHFSQ